MLSFITTKLNLKLKKILNRSEEILNFYYSKNTIDQIKEKSVDL